jgi:hypothetical protein
MAKVTYSAGIDSVSGALSKPSKNGQHSCGKMLLATHRTAATTNSNCNRIYLRDKVVRTTPVLAEELARRARFAAVAAAVAARKKDLSKVTTDTENFLAQRNEPNGKKTMKAYLWSLELAAYDARP